jgi:hypothetical protein
VTWYGWLLVSLLGLKILIWAVSVGQERKPITSEDFMVSLIINGLLIAGALTVGTGKVT